MVVRTRLQALDQAILRHVGVEPSECSDPGAEVVRCRFPRRALRRIAERIIVGPVASCGPGSPSGRS